jgi:hypothetical protein
MQEEGFHFRHHQPGKGILPVHKALQLSQHGAVILAGLPDDGV